MNTMLIDKEDFYSLGDNRKDLRIIKTKKAIKDAFIDIIKENGRESISITKLAKKAQINRGTFYLHYQNIDELANEFYDDFISQLYDLFEKDLNKSYKLTRNDQVEFTTLFQINLLKFLKNNRELFISLWFNREKANYQSKIKEYVRTILLYHNHSIVNRKSLRIPEEYYISYVLSAFMGVIALWIDKDCQEPIEEIAWIISTLNNNGIMPD